MSSKKRINLFVVILLISLGIASLLLLMPSQKDKRAAKRHEEERILGAELAAKNSVATSEDVARVRQAAQYVIQCKSHQKIADLYLFVPSLNNNIAVISGPAKNPFLGNDFRDCDVHVIPISERESPGSNVAMKLSILFPGPMGQSYVDMVGQHPTTSREALDKAWAEVPQKGKDRAESQISDNLKRSSEAGENQALLISGSFQFKAKAWFDFRDPISKITEFNRTH